MHRLPGGALGHWWRHAAGAFSDLPAGRKAGGTRPGRQDGHRHIDGHHRVHLGIQRACTPQAWSRALGHRHQARSRHCAGWLCGQPRCVRTAQRQLPRRFLWPVCEFLSRADVSGQEACPHSPDAWNRRPTGRWWLHRLSVWAGRCRGWLCQRALHDMVQRTHPQCGCHQCCPWFSHRAGQRGGLCDQRPVGYLFACRFFGLRVATCSGRHCHLQRAHCPSGSQGSA